MEKHDIDEHFKKHQAPITEKNFVSRIFETPTRQAFELAV